MSRPVKVGLLNDMSAGPPSPSDLETWLNLVISEYQAAGRINFPIEFVNSWGLGLPAGSEQAVIAAYEELVEQEVDIVIGPAIGDNALIATPLAEKFKMPTINWAGTERARNHYMFHLQIGSHEDESILIAQYLAQQKAKNIGVIYDDSPIGIRYFNFLEQEAAVLGINLVNSIIISPTADSVPAVLADLVSEEIDALIYLGLGIVTPLLANALAETPWQGLKVMNSAGIRGYIPTFAQAIDGWVYVDLFADNNQLLNRLKQTHNVPAQKSLALAKGYDLGRILAEGIARAPEISREGIIQGLEAIKWLPAAEGEEGTLISFGNQDRGALHGRYLVLRQWLHGETIAVDH